MEGLAWVQVALQVKSMIHEMKSFFEHLNPVSSLRSSKFHLSLMSKLFHSSDVNSLLYNFIQNSFEVMLKSCSLVVRIDAFEGDSQCGEFS